MGLLEQYTARQPGSDFRKKCEEALFVAASSIRNEAENTANHAKRVTWMRNVESNTQEILSRMIARIMAVVNKPDPATATDVEIQNAVNGLINSFLDE